MGSVSEAPRTAASEVARAFGGGGEQSFGDEGSVLSAIARMLWPHKTAAHLAAATNCSVRAAEMYLAGDREFSGDALAAVINEVLKRHAVRNLKVRAR
jgi:hypothetical protein